MPEPLLTLSVAAYNVEAFLSQTLDSCLVPSLERLEVLVVDDGSTDGTARIAREYAKAYPGSFRLLSQANGGYGSTVNRSIAEARGTFFKLLDGDDWCDTEGLEALLDLLATSEADLVLTPYVRCEEGREDIVVDQAQGIDGGVHSFAHCPIPWRISMHSMAYRTELLRRSGLRLPGHMAYTDTDYITQPLARVSTVHISHRPVYHYRVGRAGATMEAQGRIRHRADMEALIRRMMERYQAADESTAGRVRRAWLIDDIVGHWQILFLLPPCSEAWDEICRFRELVHLEPSLHHAVIAHSQWARLFDAARRPSYRPLASAYRLFLVAKRQIRRH